MVDYTFESAELMIPPPLSVSSAAQWLARPVVSALLLDSQRPRFNSLLGHLFSSYGKLKRLVRMYIAFDSRVYDARHLTSIDATSLHRKCPPNLISGSRKSRSRFAGHRRAIAVRAHRREILSGDGTCFIHILNDRVYSYHDRRMRRSLIRSEQVLCCKQKHIKIGLWTREKLGGGDRAYHTSCTARLSRRTLAFGVLCIEFVCPLYPIDQLFTTIKGAYI